VPRGVGFQLQASARNGDIDSKLDLPVTSSGEGHTVAGKVGSGGPRVELVADHGDIEITTTDLPPAPPTPPEPPSPPPPPAIGGRAIRHLHPAKGADSNSQPVVQ